MKLFEEFVNELNKSTYRNAGIKAAKLGQDRAIDFYKASGEVENYDDIKDDINAHKSDKYARKYNENKSLVVKVRSIVEKCLSEPIVLWDEGNNHTITLRNRNKGKHPSKSICYDELIPFIDLFYINEVNPHGTSLHFGINLDTKKILITGGVGEYCDTVFKDLKTNDIFVFKNTIKKILKEYPNFNYQPIIDIMIEVVKAI